MATLEEVAAGLDRVAGKADEARAALAQAGELATAALTLLLEVMPGSHRLEDEFNRAADAWSAVVTGIAELSEIAAAGCEAIEGHCRALRGNGPPQPSVEQGAATGSAAPTSTTAPSQETTWLEQQRSQLPTYVTSGTYRDEDGNTDLVQSGQEPDGEHLAIGTFLQPLGFPRGGRGRVAAAEHVEIKVAWRQRNAGISHTELVVNNELCIGLYSCANLLPYVLLPGQTMTIHGPVESETFTGRSLP